MIKKNTAFTLALFISVIFLFSQCTFDKKEMLLPKLVDNSCFPDEVGKIFIGKCATAGCHNTKSKDAAAGLDMSSYDELFKGSRGGAAIIPYNSTQSFLVNFINTYSDLGVIQLPTMPNNGTPLSREEVMTVIKWINDGAPDCNGHRFTDNPDRKKFYITNQGCDLVAVFDAGKKVLMKYVKVGGDPNLIESPHRVNISPDGKYWYVSFIGGPYFQKYRTSDDSLVGQVNIGYGSWNTFAFTPDSKFAYLPDYNSGNQGYVAIVDCETMTLKDFTPFVNPFPSSCPSPHGSFISPDGLSLYLTKQEGNGLYKIDLPTPYGNDLPVFPNNYSNPHEIAFSPDGTIYFVTCEGKIGNAGVLVYRVSDDAFLKKIDVAADPVEMAFSLSKPYLFVTCMTGNAVSIINYQDTTLIKTISNAGFAFPHAIAVDDANGVCYVASRNIPGSGGPPPHHTSVCGGADGFLNAIDLNTLELIPGFKPELSVDPYSIAIRK
ncbi:MAG: c-type cytochrome domain-containing protein [Bacteroidota bacterium]